MTEFFFNYLLQFPRRLCYCGPCWGWLIRIRQLDLESVYSSKTNTNMKQCDEIVHRRTFYVGRPYEGVERTAGVRATHRYNNVWTGTMPMATHPLECFVICLAMWAGLLIWGTERNPFQNNNWLPGKFICTTGAALQIMIACNIYSLIGQILTSNSISGERSNRFKQITAYAHFIG